LPNPLRCALGVLIGFVALAGTAPAAQQGPDPNDPAISEFNRRIDEYMNVRGKAVSAFKALKPDASQAEIATREKALAEAIRTARAGAKPGDIFAPATAQYFKRATQVDFERRSPKGKQLRLDELPKFHPVVNQTYPSTWPLQTFPPTLLKTLPTLPPELEYRFVDNGLILRDTKANIVVDFVLDVM
jgi:hypothetical protein